MSILPVREKIPHPKKIKKKKPRAKPEKPEKPKKTAKSPSAEDLKTGLRLLFDLLPRLLRPIRTLLRRTTLANLELALQVVGRDAADTALSFGKANAAVYSALAAADQIFTLRIRHIGIAPDFIGEKTVLCLAVELRLVPLFALMAGCNLAGIALWAFLKTALQQNKVTPTSTTERDVSDGKQRKKTTDQ